MSNEILKIEVEITNEKLYARRCNRCTGTVFNAIVFKRDHYAARCADCTFHNTAKGCNRVVDFIIGDETTIVRCGEAYPADYGTIESASTIPLAICRKCHKIVALQ